MAREEILFLHLLMFDINRDKFLMDNALTEGGISEALKCSQSHISRLLNINEKNGFIIRTKARIFNESRRKFIFCLTEKGKVLAHEIMKKYNISKKK